MGATASGLVRDQGTIDQEHIRLLAIFHFVAAGMAFLGLLFIAGHYAIFRLVLSNPEIWEKASGARAHETPALVMALFRWLYAFFGTWFAVSGVANVLSGIFMRRFRHRLFSLIVAGFNCFHVPLGTILGVFTFIVLSRESIVKSYDDLQQRS